MFSWLICNSICLAVVLASSFFVSSCFKVNSRCSLAFSETCVYRCWLSCVLWLLKFCSNWAPLPFPSCSVPTRFDLFTSLYFDYFLFYPIQNPCLISNCFTDEITFNLLDLSISFIALAARSYAVASKPENFTSRGGRTGAGGSTLEDEGPEKMFGIIKL